MAVAHVVDALALTEWSQGRATEADATAAAMLQHVLYIQSEFLHPVAVGFLAELDLRRGGRVPLRSSGPGLRPPIPCATASCSTNPPNAHPSASDR